MKQIGSKMGRCEWEAWVPGKLRLFSALARCKAVGTHGKYEHGSSHQPRERMFHKMSNALIGRMVQKAGVLNGNMS